MKKFINIITILGVAAAALFMTGCEGKDPGNNGEPAKAELKVTPEELSFAAAETEKQLTVDVKEIPDWSVDLENDEDSSWLSFKRNDKVITVTVTRPEGREEKLEGNLVFSGDAEEVTPVKVKVTALMPNGPEEPEYKLEVDETSLTFEAKPEGGQTVVVTTNIPEWTVGVGIDYAGWISADKDGNNVTITLENWNSQTLTRSGIVSVIPTGGEAEPVEIKVTQLADNSDVKVTDIWHAAYYGDEDGKGTGKFVLQIEQNGIAQGFYIEAYSELATDADNFAPRLGDYTADTDGTCAAGTFRIGSRKVDDGANAMFKSNFEGSRVYYSGVGAVNYIYGTVLTGGKLSITKEGENYIVYTKGATGKDMKTYAQNDAPIGYKYTGPITFENRVKPDDTTVYTGSIAEARAQWGSTGLLQNLGFMIEGSFLNNFSLQPKKTAPYKSVYLITGGNNYESSSTPKVVYTGTYNRFSTSLPSAAGDIRTSTNASSLYFYCSYYIEGDGAGNETVILIQDGSMTISESAESGMYDITVDFTGIDSKTGGAAEIKLTGTKSVTKI